MYHYNGDNVDIENLKKMENRSLANYIFGNEKLLLNKDIRNLLMQEERHYVFVWVVQKLNNYNYISDDDMVDRILKDKRKNDKLNAILTSCKNIENFIKNERILKEICSPFLINYIDYVDLNSARIIMDYLIKNNLEEYFSFFNENIKVELLKDKTILKKILNSSKLKNIIKSSTNNVFEILAQYEKAQNIILNYDFYTILSFVTNKIYFPANITSNKKFQETILNIEDITTYRFFMDQLEQNNSLAAYEIDKIKEKIYDKEVEKYSDGLFLITKKIVNLYDKKENYSLLLTDNMKKYIIKEMINNSKNMHDVFYKYDTLKMRNILIDRYFKDIPLNFLKNLNVMIQYNDSLNNKILDEKRTNIYKKILNFENLNYDERKELYYACAKYENLAELFYDDYRKCRDNTYNNLIDLAINPKKMYNLLSIEKTKKYGVPIYELNGENFYAFVHITGPYKYNHNFYVEAWKEGLYDSVSLSFIGNNNITTFGDPKESIAFGFSKLDYKRIIHLRNSDSFSNYNSMDDCFSDYIQKMYTPANLIKETRGYNEIVYQEKSRNIKLDTIVPDYVMCYDEVTDSDINVAKYYNLPIVLINTKKYKFNNKIIDVSESEKYINGDDYYMFK